MKSTKAISSDLQIPGFPEVVHLKQYDANTRYITIPITDGGSSFTLPDNPVFMVGARLPDGSKVLFDKIINASAPIGVIVSVDPVKWTAQGITGATFTKTASGWSKNGSAVDLNDYGISIMKGTPATGANIVVSSENAVNVLSGSIEIGLAPSLSMIAGTGKIELYVGSNDELISTYCAELQIHEAAADPYSAFTPQSVCTIIAQIQAFVQAELTAHPEWTTTLADGAVTDAKLSANVKSQLINGLYPLTLDDYTSTNCTISDSNKLTRSGSKYKSRQIPQDGTYKYLYIRANADISSNVTFLTTTLDTAPTSGTDISSYLATGETGRHIISTGTSECLKIPSNCTNIVVAVTSNNNDATPQVTAFASDLYGDVLPLIDDHENNKTETVLKQVTAESGVIIYWGENREEVREATAAYTGISRLGNLVTLNSAGQTQNRCHFKLSGDLKRVTTTAELGNFEKELALVAGHTYKIKSELVSGTLTLGEGVQCNVRLRDSSNNDLINESGTDSGINYDSETLYKATANMSTVLFVTTFTGFVATNAVLRITIVDATAATANILISDTEAIPSYYADYLTSKLETIQAHRNAMSAKTAEWFFITDTHHQYNMGHSYDLLDYMRKMTGINVLLYGGDAGGVSGSSDSAVYKRFAMSTEAWCDFEKSVPRMYGVLGNHEHIASPMTYPAQIDAYLGRYKFGDPVMDEETGCYFVDNNANKIRFFFIQNNLSAAPVSGSIPWFGNALKEVPEGYAVVLTVHFAYIPSSATYDEYDGVSIEYNYKSIKAMSQLLHAYMVKGSFTYSDIVYDYSTLVGDRPVICVFNGHVHHGVLYTNSEESGIEGINVFRGSSDAMHAASVAVDGKPWYWLNGVVGGTKVVREAGTTNEQCFYVVQCDLDAGQMYITAIGGDNDYSCTF